MEKQLFREPDRVFVSYFKQIMSSAKSVVLAGHKSPDDDCIASLLTTYTYLKEYLGFEGNLRMVITGDEQKRWNYFKYFEEIEFVDDLANEISEEDVVVLLDGSQWHRFSNERSIGDFSGVSVCIDHHVVSGNVFNVALVAPQYSSNTEILYRLFFTKEDIHKDLAEVMLLGILGDTGNFRYLNHENSSALIVGERLIREGGVDIQILESKYRGIDPDVLPVFREYLKNTAFIEEEGWPKIAYTYLGRKSAEKYGDKLISQVKHLVLNYLLNFSNVEFCFMVRPRDEYSNVSLRSIGTVDVNKIASDLKIGGGHTSAAGGSIEGSPKKMIGLFKKYVRDNPVPLQEK